MCRNINHAIFKHENPKLKKGEKFLMKCIWGGGGGGGGWGTSLHLNSNTLQNVFSKYKIMMKVFTEIIENNFVKSIKCKNRLVVLFWKEHKISSKEKM